MIDDKKDGDDNSFRSRNRAVPVPISLPISESSKQQGSMLQQQVQDHEATIRDLKQTISEQRQTIDEAREGEQIQQAQNWSISDQFNSVKAELDNLISRTANQDGLIRNLKWQLEAENARFGSLTNSHNEKDQELSARSNTIRVLSEHNQQLQARVTGLENILAMASRKTGKDLQTFFDRYTEMEAAQNQMMQKFQASEDVERKLQEALHSRESEVASLNVMVNQLQQEHSGFELCQPATLRSLLTMRHVEQASVEEINDEEQEDDHQLQTWVPTGLPQSRLAKICTSDEIQRLAKLLPKGRPFNNFYERLKLDICSVCSKAKFNIKLDAHPRHQSVRWLDEYLGSSRYFTCCQEKVCKECFKKHLIETLESKWWNRLGTLQWFPCPRVGFDEALGIRCEADLQICLERNLGTPADDYVKM